MPQQMPGLTIDLPPNDSHVAQRLSSPINLHGIDISSLDARDIQVGASASSTPLPSSPDERERETTQSFFGNRGTSPSAGRAGDEAPMNASGEGRSRSISLWTQPHGKTTASSLTESDGQEGRKSADAGYSSKMLASDQDHDPDTNPAMNMMFAAAQPPYATPGNLPGNRQPQPEAKKTNKKRLQMLSRSKSLRAEDELSKPKKISNKKVNGHQAGASTTFAELTSRSVPLSSDKDRSFRDMMKTSMRDRSEDRMAEFDDDKQNKSKQKKEKKEVRDKQIKEARERQPLQRQGHPLSSSLRQHNTSTFFNDFRNTSSNAAIGIGKAGKGLFSKFSRSGSSSDKPAAPVENHIPSVLVLPLVDQTRITRIAKSYDQCKDKTEFWMPALPWRCIDYLNGKCEEEGLYRVSGGLTKVKEWRKRFDTELDVNLLDESELYDASIIASLFKEWIRELPEDVFPKDAQERITAQLPRELPERGSITQLLRDELQQLPPFNYYLLFAITCHLSLLLSYESRNKMTLDNLYRCFNQSLKLDGRIFYTLVGEWRQCWAGCLTENDFLKAEYDYLQHPYPQFIRDIDDYAAAPADERAISSSGSSAPPATGIFTPDLQRPVTSHTQPSHSAEDGEAWLTPMKKTHRSSSDVTGVSPMKSAFETTPVGTPQRREG